MIFSGGEKLCKVGKENLADFVQQPSMPATKCANECANRKITFMMWMPVDFSGNICSGKISYQPEALSTANAFFLSHYFSQRILFFSCGLCSGSHASHLLFSPSASMMPPTPHRQGFFFLNVHVSMFLPWEENILRKEFGYLVVLWVAKTRGTAVRSTFGGSASC